MKLSSSFCIGDRLVGEGAPCFVIAEAGVAHFGDYEKAFQLVDLATEAKADAVKFQIFNIEAMIAQEGQEWRDRLSSRVLKNEDFADLMAYCNERDVLFFATAHDEPSFNYLASLEPQVFKIGSGEYRNWSYLKKVAALGKPVILSTGMYTETDVVEALRVMTETGNMDIAVLQCTTHYPTPFTDVNLRVMDRYRELFGGVIGYSDHTAGYHIPLAAVARGAQIIEKHISIDFNVPNAQDWKVSCGPHDLGAFITQLRDVENALGSMNKSASADEAHSLTWARKSLVAACTIPAGTVISSDMLVCKRPGTGIAPDEIDQVIGRQACVGIVADQLVKWNFLS